LQQPPGTNLWGFYVFLKLLVMREKLLPTQRIKVIQEELAGFLPKEVIHEKGVHYVEDEERYM
jgi:hypothetical protein